MVSSHGEHALRDCSGHASGLSAQDLSMLHSGKCLRNIKTPKDVAA